MTARTQLSTAARNTPGAASAQRAVNRNHPVRPATWAGQGFAPVAAHDDPREHAADTAARAALGKRTMPMPPPFGGQPHADERRSIALPPEAGRSLSATTRQFAENAFGCDFSAVRVHDSEAAHNASSVLRARAFTLGSNVWLGHGEAESDLDLLAHELAHVAEANGNVIYLRSATWIERRGWLAFFEHYLPRKFLNNYMDDTGKTIKLTEQEMVDCNPIVDLHRSPALMSEVAALKSKGGSKAVKVSGWGGALTNGTLGNFTIHYDGTVKVTAGGDWEFTGTMNFYDFWDFDPKTFGKSGRSTAGELKVRVANAALPGRPFDITSVDTPVSQKSSDGRATWAGDTPTPVGDKSGRTSGDIAAGGVSGDVAAGPPGGDVGAAAGGQSSEDLNK